jgi:cell division protein FtsW
MVRRARFNLIYWLIEPFYAKRGAGHQPDMILLVTVAVLTFLGILFLSSASATQSFYRYHDTYRLVKQQLLHGILPGLVLFYFAFRTDYVKLQKFSKLFLVLCFVMLLLVFVSKYQNQYGSAQSWIILGGFSFQPTELVKLLYIAYLASWLDGRYKELTSWSKGTIPFLVILLIISALIIKQPDFGTLLIILCVALSMFFVAGASRKHLIYIISSGILAFFVLIKAAPYRMNRFIAWWNPDIDPKGIGWQLKQSLIAVGSGGWLGLGLGNSKQKSYVPMPANDSIFAIMAEEIGFIFALGIIFLFVIVLWRGLLIAKYAPDNYSRFFAVGIVIWLTAQVFVNIAGLLQIMPLTGVTLPFISLGGSNLTVTLMAVGILANISRDTTA